ncbi:Protein of unknown function DUF4445 [Acididesulfobacillus acetoxydans]|uniref:Ferredoxin n=1 Tax=Acididesulfobacillus acetoxydans TaxID=1561005 RepID=A0A8S0W3F2_9FIRM|nr:ASKHA domain-containing protein [Acididesulfobacillus acetoxydans]CAA7601608.1 Protein of unknown function DUF4445 [Acididesulfobacillus acetoxydans]CEJ07095.1 Ferredoxin [Acididesulfobacillus acetoxydans]
MSNPEVEPVILTGQSRTHLENLEPLSRKVFLPLSGPTPRDNRAIADRIRQALAPDYGRVAFPLSLMAELPGLWLLNNARGPLTVTLAETENSWRIMDIEAGDTRRNHLGLAIDIGTTTVVVYLVDLASGEILRHAPDYNGQVPLGEDILSRIRSAAEAEGLENLRQAVLGTLNRLIRRLSPAPGDTRAISAIAIGANTTMVHLLLGLNPASIAKVPYTPVVNNPGILTAAEIGLEVHPLAPVYCLPSVGSFLGGDVVAGILVSGLHRQTEVSLFVDIGTNGEIVLGCADWLAACAGAAGPALEGGVTTFGMRAEPGAIDRVSILPGGSPQVEFSTIGNIPARGICGSGLVDTLAELFLHGLVDRRAHLLNGQEQFLLVPRAETDPALDRDIAVSQADIDNLMATKGAVNAAIDLLLENVGCSWQEIHHFYAAGAFGQYLPVESAIAIGLYPDLPRAAIIRLGNSSGEGARQALLSRAKRLEAEAICSKLTYFELNAEPAFMDKFRSSKFLPHTDLARYPSVEKRLADQKSSEL